MSDSDESEYQKAERLLRQAVKELGVAEDEKSFPSRQGEPPYCSFCGKGRKDYRYLVPGPSVYICDTCVAEAQRIIDEAEKDKN